MVISKQSTEDISVSPDEAVLTGVSDSVTQLISFKEKGEITLSNQADTVDVQYTELKRSSVLPKIVSLHFPVAVVNDSAYQQLAKNLDPDIQGGVPSMLGLTRAITIS